MTDGKITKVELHDPSYFGKENTIPDALSRFPWAGICTLGTSSQEVDEAEGLEEAIVAEISSSKVSWPGFKCPPISTKKYKRYANLCERELTFYVIGKRYLNGLHTEGGFMETEGILTFKGRVIIPREQR